MFSSFPLRLKELREEKKLTQRELSKLLGFNKTAVSVWEASQSVPNLNAVIKLAAFFSVSVGYLAGTEE